MKDQFKEILDQIEKKYESLVIDQPFKCGTVGKEFESKAGVYLLYENGEPLYVGRTRNLRSRLRSHIQNSHNSASFAFLLARKKTGLTKASYQTSGSRVDLLQTNEHFRKAFDEARDRIRNMDVKVIEEKNPISQALLEIYVAFMTRAKYNEFGTS